MRKTRFAAAVILFAAFTTNLAIAQDTYWFVPTQGDWNDWWNWTGGPPETIPEGDDMAVIGAGQTCWVLAADQAAREIAVGSSPPDIGVLLVIGRTLTVGEDSTEQTIQLTNTSRLILQSNGPGDPKLVVRGTVTIDGTRSTGTTYRSTFRCLGDTIIEPYGGVPGSATLKLQGHLDVFPEIGTVAVTTNLEMLGAVEVHVLQGAQFDIGAPQPGPNVPYFRGESSSGIWVLNGKVTFQVVRIGTSAEADASRWCIFANVPESSAELRVSANADTVSRNGDVRLGSPPSKLFFDSNHTTHGDLKFTCGQIEVAAGKTVQFGID